MGAPANRAVIAAHEAVSPDKLQRALLPDEAEKKLRISIVRLVDGKRVVMGSYFAGTERVTVLPGKAKAVVKALDPRDAQRLQNAQADLQKDIRDLKRNS
jgi:hypothetical protein